ncbi:MAG: preprotein translocase subunit SecG [Xanthomonadales bacterium]|nr:preprotein translocase subunit SecG [Xanthomonadales bacterium]
MTVNLLLILFVLVVVAMIAFILVQKGAGATAGSAFGSGASATVFGAKGSGNFLTKSTMTLAFLFFAISLFMAVQASKDFAVQDAGEIDLGVVGTLNTSDSDVPQITPVGGSQESDVPAMDVNESVNSDETDVPAVSDDTTSEESEDTGEDSAEVSTGDEG